MTYERSRDARLDEAETDARDVYALVYDADRPELFLKDAAMRRTTGPGGVIRARSDSRWTVPEPELGVVIGEDGKPLAVTIGNDVSSRDIEGANPLYIPQAKIFAGACAIGPALLAPDDWEVAFAIRLRITGADGAELFAGETSTANMKRTPRELVEWVVRDNPVPPRLGPAHGHRHRPARRVHARAGARRRDRDRRHRRARQHRRLRGYGEGDASTRD